MKNYTVIGFLTFLTILSGCTPEVTQWTAAESPKKNKVERALFMYTVSCPAHANALENREKKKLQNFLKDTIPSPFSVVVTLSEYGGSSETRIKDIKRELLKHGIPEAFINVEQDQGETCHKYSQKETGSGVELIVERYVVIPPSCSNFSQNIGDAKQTAQTSNFGCSVEANLGMMIANPRDLIRGRSRESYTGMVLTEGIRRYREGKITPLMQSGTTVPATQQQQQSTSSTGTQVTPGVQ